jgi:hypothetical protein
LGHCVGAKPGAPHTSGVIHKASGAHGLRAARMGWALCCRGEGLVGGRGMGQRDMCEGGRKIGGVLEKLIKTRYSRL